MEYRKAEIDDVEQLVILRMAFLHEVGTDDGEVLPETLREELYNYFNDTIPSGKFIAWLAEQDGLIVGTSGLSFFTIPPSHKNYTGKNAYIMNMYTKPDYRRQGIGSVLFEKILEEAKRAGMKRIVLHATEMGKSLYQKYGFAKNENEMVLDLK